MSDLTPAGAPKLTNCVNGHDLNEANTYIRPDGQGRQCKPCARNRNREYMRGYRARKARGISGGAA